MEIVARALRKFNTYVKFDTSLNVKGDEETFIEDFRKIIKFGNAANNKFVIYSFPRPGLEAINPKVRPINIKKHIKAYKRSSNQKCWGYLTILR